MARVSKSNLRQMFAHAVRRATAAGLNAEGWYLEMGSGSNGVAYELSSDNHHSRERLGATMAEAYATLEAMARAWQMIEHAARDKGETKIRIRRIRVTELTRGHRQLIWSETEDNATREVSYVDRQNDTVTATFMDGTSQPFDQRAIVSIVEKVR